MSYSNVKIAKKYAKVLFDLSFPDRLDDREGKLHKFLEVFKAMSAPLLNPVISQDEKSEILTLALSELNFDDVEFCNFLRVVFDNKRLGALEDVLLEFSALIKLSRNIISLEITISKEINDDEKREMVERLSHIMQRQISVKWNVDQTIIGGVIIKVGDKLLDTSLKGFLEKAAKEMVSVSY